MKNVSLIDIPLAYGKHFAAEALKSITGPSSGHLPIEIREDHVDFKYKDRDLRFYYDSEARLLNITTFINEVFIRDVYRSFNVKDRVVLDLGANIGDTAIYFAMNGAKKVYAFEAVPRIFAAAKKNVAANGLNDRIEVFNEAAGQPGTHVVIAENEERAGEVKPAEKGITIKCSSLEELTQRIGASGAALKIDCEGCEYDLILKSSNETLRHYADIVLEYHYGYKDLEAKLKDAGFDVWYKRPIYINDKASTKPDLMLGILWARLKESSGAGR